MSDQTTPRQAIIKAIVLRLGGTVLRQKLTPEHLDFAVDNAINRYRQRSSNAVEESFLVLDVQPDQQTYRLPNEVQDVREIYRNGLGNNTGEGSTIDPFSLAVTNNIYQTLNPGSLGGGTTGTLATYEMAMGYQKLLGRMFGRDVLFNFNPVSKLLFVKRKFTGVETIIMSVYNEKPEQTLLVDPYARTWLQDFATAEAKEMLGEILGRFAGGLGGPQGTITLNGAELKAEGLAEKQRLEEEIKNNVDSSFGLPFIFG